MLPPKQNNHLISIFGASALYDIILNLISVEISLSKDKCRKCVCVCLKESNQITSISSLTEIYRNQFIYFDFNCDFFQKNDDEFNSFSLVRFAFNAFSSRYSLRLFILFTNGCICVFHVLDKKVHWIIKKSFFFFFFSFCFHCVRRRNMFLFSSFSKRLKTLIVCDELSQQ